MDGFTDLLEDIQRSGGILMWITKKKEFIDSSSMINKRTPEQIKQDVIQSPRLRHVIDKILTNHAKTFNSQINAKFDANQASKTKTTLPMADNNSEQVRSYLKIKREEIEKEAKSILDEMAHDFNLYYVRTLGYFMIQVFSRIFKHIFYNTDMVENMQVAKHYPTVLLPLHRSYMDFMIISVLCFHKDLKMPAVAAGQDFLGLSFLSKVIRHCGAFFIRRSFGSDELYWGIFHQYVQEHLTNCDRPCEFFIEGTRSRTSKSLLPKQGMLATCAELFMKGHRVDDIYFVPISLTYEKLLEEMLYSTELLGIPKPKETVSGLVKARTILNQSFGSIFVNFAKPISLRELIYQLEGPTLNNRLSQTLTPRFVFKLENSQLKTIESISYILLLDMLRNQIIQPISLIATCILSAIKMENNFDRKQMFEFERSISLEALCVQTEKLKRVLINLGAKVYWPVDKVITTNINDEMNRLKHLILDNIEAHINLFNLFLIANDQVAGNTTNDLATKFGFYLNVARKEPLNECKIVVGVKSLYDKNASFSSVKLKEKSIFDSASIYLAVCSYKNQLVHFLVRIGFVCNSLLASAACRIGSSLSNANHLNSLSEKRAFEIYKYLSCLFNREFIFKSDDDFKDFKDALCYLINTNLLKVVDGSENDLTNSMDRKFELTKFNLNQFIFFVSLFQSIIQNYNQVYSMLLKTSDPVIEFDNEKLFTQQIQQSLINKMIEKSNLDSNASTLYDYEILSLNQITNSLLTLRQFFILNKLEKVIKDAKTNSKRNIVYYIVDLGKLAKLNERLEFIIKTNRFKLIHLNILSKSFDLLSSSSTSPVNLSSVAKTPNYNNISSSQFDLSDYDESLLSISKSSPIWNNFNYYENLFQIKDDVSSSEAKQASRL